EYFEGFSTPVELSGAAVDVDINVEQRTDLVALQLAVDAVNSADANDNFQLFAPDVRVVDSETGFEYIVLVGKQGPGLPPTLVPGRKYDIVVRWGPDAVQTIDVPMLVPATAKDFVTAPPLEVPFTPLLAQSEAQLFDALNQANAKPGFDVIELKLGT